MCRLHLTERLLEDDGVHPLVRDDDNTAAFRTNTGQKVRTEAAVMCFENKPLFLEDRKEHNSAAFYILHIFLEVISSACTLHLQDSTAWKLNTIFYKWHFASHFQME